jgi:hypothetical protein
MPRYSGRTVLVWTGLCSVAALFAQTVRFESPRLEAWTLGKDSIQESGSRRGLPKFITWPTAREIFPCGGGSPALPRKVAVGNLLDESFHYNPQAAMRLCEPLAAGTGAMPLDGAQAAWEKSILKPAAMTPPFPEGTQLAAAFWNAVRRPADPGNGKIVQLPVRIGNDVQRRTIRITVPKHLGTGSASCEPPAQSGESGAANGTDVSLDEFFWVRLNPGERYNGASCGDFAVLMAFHLVHKVHGKWLWTTFWWDPESKEFGGDRPKNFEGAGAAARAWRNYAMDASVDSSGIIFNPWRIEERGDNCARCHKEVAAYKSGTSEEQITFDSVTAARAHFQ